MGIITGTEKPFGAAEQARVMLSPFHTSAGPEILQRTFTHMEHILHQQGRAGQIDRACGIRQAKFLFLAERIFGGRLVKGDLAPGGLAVRPLANVTFVRVCVARQLGR